MPIRRVLVAEDEEMLRDALSRRLEQDGFIVKTARDGVEALVALNKMKFDALLLDLLMPNKDGFSVLKELNPARRPKVIMVLSNMSVEGRDAEMRSYGVSDFLIKADTPIKEISRTLKAFGERL